jgi:hypothetical protein
MLDLLKGSLKSTTVQFNLAATALWVLGVVMASDFVRSNPDYLAIAAGVQGIVNVLLRFKTSKPLSER